MPVLSNFERLPESNLLVNSKPSSTNVLVVWVGTGPFVAFCSILDNYNCSILYRIFKFVELEWEGEGTVGFFLKGSKEGFWFNGVVSSVIWI